MSPEYYATSNLVAFPQFYQCSFYAITRHQQVSQRYYTFGLSIRGVQKRTKISDISFLKTEPN